MTPTDDSSTLSGLNHRQQLFVMGLVAGRSQAEAYRAAGYASSNPEVNASRLLRNAKVRLAVQEMAQEQRGELLADARERNAFWTSVMRDSNVPMKERLRASELLGKAGGDFHAHEDTRSGIRVEFRLDGAIDELNGGYEPPNPLEGVVGLPALPSPDPQ